MLFLVFELSVYRLCDAFHDWGGVAPEFWEEAIERYDWDVNRSSIETQPDTLFAKRYHVFLRKLKGQNAGHESL